MAKIDKINLSEIFKKLVPAKVSYEIRTFDHTLSGDCFSEFRTKFPLSESEYQDIQRSVPRREIEYRMGRFMARKLLGLDPGDTKTSLYKKPNGATNWPQNILGSISHSESTCIVALTNEKQFSGIGIDIELGIFEPGLESMIVVNEESREFPGHLPHLAKLRAIFCCKEALYKSLEKLLSERIDFLDVNIRFIEAIETNIYKFGVQFTRNIPGLITLNSERLYGRVYADEQLAVSVVMLKLDAT